MQNWFLSLDPRRSLRARTSLIFGGSVLLLMALTSWQLGRASRSRLEKRTGGELMALAFQLSDKLDRGLFERHRDIQIAASLPSLWNSATPLEDRRALLGKIQSTFPDYAWIGFTDPRGRVVVSTAGLLEGTDVSDHPWFQAAQKQPYFGDVHDGSVLARELPNPTSRPVQFLDIAAPVFDPQGQLQGILGSHLYWWWADEVAKSLLAASPDGAQLAVTVISKEGVVLLGTKENSSVSMAGPAAPVGRGFRIERGEDGTPYLVGYVHSEGYRTFAGLEWTVLVRQRASEVFAPARAQQTFLLATGGALTLLFFWLGWFTAERLVRPLQNLAATARRIADGHTSAEMPTISVLDEAGALSSAFASMVKEMQRRHQLLEAAVKARTAAWEASKTAALDASGLLVAANKELALAREETQRANSAKGEFLASISHEIRTPMNGVIGMTTLLRETQLNFEQRQCVETIQSCGESLSLLVNDVLDFSRIEAGQIQLENASFDVIESVEKCVDRFGPQAAEKSLDLVCSFSPDLPRWVRGDVTRLRQVLSNLVNNGLKFTEQGEVAIEVKFAPPRMASKDESKITLYFEVTDSGSGIASENQDRLFKHFSQVDTSTTRRHGGSGLGLAICKRLVELMGGTIGVRSEEGFGSRFYFTINVERVANLTETHSPLPLPLQGKHLLLVDGQSSSRRVITMYAAAWGMRVTECVQATDALSHFEDGAKFDYGLVDIRLPDMSGLDLITAIRNRFNVPPLPIALLMAGSFDHDRNHLAQLDVYQSVLKPIKAKPLRQLLMTLAQPRAESRPPIPLPANVPSPKLAQAQPLTILVAEDNLVNQRVALRTLGLYGYVADLAANGREAVLAIRARPYDVIFMDIQMPELDGVQATRQIRAEIAAELQPWIIALTAEAMNGDRERLLAMGMNDYLSKPLDKTALERALRHAARKLEERRDAVLHPSAHNLS